MMAHWIAADHESTPDPVLDPYNPPGATGNTQMQNKAIEAIEATEK